MEIVAVPIKEYIDKYTADDTDFYKIYNSVVYDACRYYNVMIAGGSLRRLITNTPISGGDIDLYNCKKRNGRAERFLWNSFPQYVSTPASYKLAEKLQIIYGTYTEGPRSIFSTYDFSVCCFATDLKNIYGTEQAFEDIKHNVLHLNKMHKKYPKLPRKSRLDKYKALGYEIGPEITGMLYEKFLEEIEPRAAADEVHIEIVSNDPYEGFLVDLSETNDTAEF